MVDTIPPPRKLVEITKPPFGSPCNSCGLCCRIQLCPLGSFVFKKTNGPCPALTAENKCGLITDPKYSKAKRDAAHHLNGAGDGCDAYDPATDDARVRSEIRLRWYVQSQSDEGQRKTAEAKRAWGVR